MTLLTLSTSTSSGASTGPDEQQEAAGQLAHNLSQSLSRIRSSAGDTAHIKVQLPDGVVISKIFSADSFMTDVYQWVRQSSEVGAQDGVDPQRLLLQETVLARRKLPANRVALIDLGLCPGSRLSAIEMPPSSVANDGTAPLSRLLSAPRGALMEVKIIGLVGGSQLPEVNVLAGQEDTVSKLKTRLITEHFSCKVCLIHNIVFDHS